MPTENTGVQVKWINKAAAAEILEVDPRTILLMARDGRLRSQRMIDPASNQTAVMLDAGDVERLKYERDNPSLAVQVAKPAKTAPSSHQELRQWLDLTAAEDYIGLPAGFILRLIRAGKLPALDVGVERREWRVARRDLDALEGRIYFTASLQARSSIG